MKRILKRYLALLLVALLVITGTPMASFAAETPSITNFVGTATGATSGEFTWEFNNPSGLTIESSSAVINETAIPFDVSKLKSGIMALSGLSPKTDYELLINVKYSTLSEENYIIEKIIRKVKSIKSVPVEGLEIYSKQPNANTGDELSTYHKEKNSNPDNIGYSSAFILLKTIYPDIISSTDEIIRDEDNAGWRIHGNIVLKYEVETEIVDYKWNDTLFTSYDEALEAIKASLNYTPFNTVETETGVKIIRKNIFEIDDDSLFTTKSQNYTVTFVNADAENTVLKTEEVESGKAATAPSDPTLAGHTFTGWDKVFTNITGPLTVTAVYTKDSVPPTKFMVTFVNADAENTVLKTEEVESGKAATAPSDPTLAGHTFTGWDKAFTNITGPLTVTAVYTKDSVPPTKFMVTFVNADAENTVLKTEEVESGKAATAPSDPTLVGHTFTGWDKAFTNITGPLTVTAVYTKDSVPPTKFMVTFVNADAENTVLKTEEVESGKAATAPADPTLAGHTFTGWDKAFANITGPLTVTAVYTKDSVPPAKFMVTFVNADAENTVLKTEEVESGKAATAPSDPTLAGHTFTGWDKAFTNITGPLTVTAVYTKDSVPPAKFIVTFVNADAENTVLKTEEVESGKAATAPADPTLAGHTFTGWDKAFTNITSSLTVKAVYSLNIVNNNNNNNNNNGNNNNEEEVDDRQIPATVPQISEPLVIVDLGEEEETPGGPAIVEEKEKEPKEEKENVPEDELITLDIPTEAIPEGSGLPQTGQLPAELFVGLGGLITAAGAFLRRRK